MGLSLWSCGVCRDFLSDLLVWSDIQISCEEELAAIYFLSFIILLLVELHSL